MVLLDRKYVLDIPGYGLFLFKVAFIFKFLNLYAQPATFWGDYASGRRMSR
jgi:hypothetical protein